MMADQNITKSNIHGRVLESYNMSVEEFIDQNGVKWVSPGKAAEIWNERAKEQGVESGYTRWSIRARREELGGMQTPLGFLYPEEKVRSIKIRPHSKKRPDVVQKNKGRRKITAPPPTTGSV